jgi:hypothetical protein
MTATFRPSRLRALLDRNEPIDGTLPFIHITNNYKFDKISIDNVIKPGKCPHFKEDLIYLFYGRPAYRTRSNTNERLSFDWPVVFIFDEQKIAKNIIRAFPFDTGAFFKGKYERYFDKSSGVEDFELDATLLEIRKFISAFYQNNREYFTGSSRKNVNIAVNEFEAAGLHELARQPTDPQARTNVPTDERASAIEVQIRIELSLKGTLKGIVLPERNLDVEDWVKAIGRWKPEKIEKYSIVNSVMPEFFAGQIYSSTERCIKSLGYDL